MARIEPGNPHKFWNAGDDPLHFVAEVRPALSGSKNDPDDVQPRRRRQGEHEGRTEPVPDGRHRGRVQGHHPAAFPPAAVQDVGLALGAPLGRLLGYEPVYEPAGTPALGLGT